MQKYKGDKISDIDKHKKRRSNTKYLKQTLLQTLYSPIVKGNEACLTTMKWDDYGFKNRTQSKLKFSDNNHTERQRQYLSLKLK
jgi:hypothetical protein